MFFIIFNLLEFIKSNNMKKSHRCQQFSSISIPRLALFSLILLSSFPGILSSGIVTLASIEIYTTHEWLPTKPTVYFKCRGGNKTVLPDVKEKHLLYIFKGEESWQPLTVLPDKKCQRCGFYEEDAIKHDVFDEWEFCASDFVDGRYVRFKEKEFNATFICPECTAAPVATGGAYIVYRCWQKRKRQQDQARFLKLFEDGDDIEDELGLDHI